MIKKMQLIMNLKHNINMEIMKKLLFIIVALSFANCEPKLEEIEQYDLKGTWQLSYTTVNGKEVGNHCEKLTKIHINDKCLQFLLITDHIFPFFYKATYE